MDDVTSQPRAMCFKISYRLHQIITGTRETAFLSRSPGLICPGSGKSIHHSSYMFLAAIKDGRILTEDEWKGNISAYVPGYKCDWALAPMVTPMRDKNSESR